MEFVHNEMHRSHRVGWLRAAVLGANDGIVSTASLIIGIAAANSDHSAIVLAGLAGLIAGALSMAAGEYISVSSQADTEKADLELEQRHLDDEPEFELRELSEIYVDRGLEPELATEVARQLMAHDALAAHARDELGITDTSTANPIQAAVFSAVSFSIGAALPLAVAWLTPHSTVVWVTGVSCLIFLAILGAVAARAGGASMVKGSIRVLFWSTAAMAATFAVGKIFDANVG
ncbi:MAG TPA: VIT family protein [Pyrinomonadaceae bacterium]|nr:VIT family protein [Pyrinomonadaceae bacterium]